MYQARLAAQIILYADRGEVLHFRVLYLVAPRRETKKCAYVGP
jgi:hypothetical protein